MEKKDRLKQIQMNGVFSACISILSQLSVLISGSAKIKDKDF